MANTADTTWAGNFIQVTYSGSGDDWNCSTDAGLKRMKVRSIQFKPSASNDVLVVNEGSIDGPSILRFTVDSASDDRVKYFGDDGTWMTPYIDLTDCTFGTITSVAILFELA